MENVAAKQYDIIFVNNGITMNHNKGVTSWGLEKVIVYVGLLTPLYC